MSRQTKVLALVAVVLLDGSACSDSVAGPYPTASPGSGPSPAAVKFWDANATANWTDLATSLAARRPVNIARLSAYLSLAQLRAAEDAEATVPPSADLGGDRWRLGRRS